MGDSQVKIFAMCISTTSETSKLAISTAIRGCESLSHWISRLKAKEAILKSRRNEDLRRQVLILHATHRAQEELVLQQKLNRKRWEQIKARELEKCSICAAFKRYCSCSEKKSLMEDSEESKKLDEFFESMSTKKRRQPSILRTNSKRAKAA